MYSVKKSNREKHKEQNIRIDSILSNWDLRLINHWILTSIVKIIHKFSVTVITYDMQYSILIQIQTVS